MTKSKERKRVIDDIKKERKRQIKIHGYSHKHDDYFNEYGIIGQAAAAYALIGVPNMIINSLNADTSAIANKIWPWGSSKFKTDDRRRCLIKAAALLVAEIERLDRAEAKANEKQV